MKAARRLFAAIWPEHAPFLALLALLSAFHLWGLRFIPFHPDESTQLYMSSDFEAMLADPGSLAWDPARTDNPRQPYRLLDAPVTRLLLGLGRSIAGYPPVPAEWDWTRTWEENRQAGALPDPDLLAAGRAAVALLLPLSLVFIYLSGRRIGGSTAGWLAALLLGTNALVLLHARRAMAEGALLLGVSFFLYALLQAERRPWLAGLAVALAFNAKQSALALVPVGLLAAVWVSQAAQHRLRRAAWNAVQYAAVFLALTLALNPLLWRDPVGAGRAAWAARQAFLTGQVAFVEAVQPEQVLDTPLERVGGVLANLFLVPPSFAEAGNYSQHTRAAEARYLSVPGHNLSSGFTAGGIWMALSVWGWLLALGHIRLRPERRKGLVLLALAGLVQAAALAAAVPLPFQRYIMPLVPFVCLWIAYGVTQFSVKMQAPALQRSMQRFAGDDRVQLSKEKPGQP